MTDVKLKGLKHYYTLFCKLFPYFEHNMICVLKCNKKPQVLLSNSWRSGNKSSVSVCVNAGTVSNSSHLRSSDVCKPRVCWPPRRGVSAANHRVITKTQAPLSSNIIVSDDHDVVWRRVCCRWWCIGRRLDGAVSVRWQPVVKNEIGVWTRCTDTRENWCSICRHTASTSPWCCKGNL